MNQISLSAFANFNSAVPWGLWVAIYIWLVGISAGSFLLISWGNLRGNIYLKNVTRLGIILSLSTLLVGLLSIQIDLGHIERFYKLFTSPSPSSVMAWMVWLYTIYFIVLAGLLLVLKRQIPKPFFGFTFVFALAIIVVESLLFFMPPGKHWHSLIFPLHFFTSSLVSAIAALIFVIGFFWPKDEKEQLVKGLAKIAVAIFAINFIIEIIDMVFHANIFDMANWFLILGNIIAIALLAKATSLSVTLASLIGLISVLFSKYNTLISAQIIEPFRGFSKAYSESRLQFSYNPSLFEYLASLGLVCLAVILFYILYKVNEAHTYGAKRS